MPPSLDAYGLTDRRDEHTLDLFVRAYVDRMHEDRGDEELMMVPLGSTKVPQSFDGGFEQWEWEPAKTIAHSVQRGLDYPRRAFALYYPSRAGKIDSVAIGFTLDNKLVLGISIDDEGMKRKNQERAEQFLDSLFADYGCYIGIVTTEEPAPLSEHEFLRAAYHPLTVYRRGIDG